MSEKKLRTKNVFDKKNEFFNLTFIYLILMLAFVCVRIFAYFNLLTPLGDFEDLVYSLLIQVGIMFGLSFWLYKKFQKKSAKEVFKDFRFVKISPKAILICLGLGILIIFLNIGFNSIYNFILSLFGYSVASAQITTYPLVLFLITIFASAVLPAFCEEFANRGLLLRAFKNIGMKKLIVISGLLFGLMHLNVGQFGYAFLVGMFFAFICISTGSIWPSIIIHFMNNAFTEYITFASVNDLFLGNFYNSIQSLTLGTGYFGSIIIIFLVLMTVVFLFGWLTYLLIKEVRGAKLRAIGEDLTKTFAESPDELRPKSINVSIPYSALGAKFEQSYYPSFKHKIPLYTAIFLGTVITIMTLIWGTL